MEFLNEYINELHDAEQDTLVFIASTKRFSDSYRFAAAILLCTCDSNERMAQS